MMTRLGTPRLRHFRRNHMLSLEAKQPGIDDGRHVRSLLPDTPGGSID